LRHSDGGLSLDHTHWIQSRSRFFLSIKVLRRVFRGKFVAALKQAFRSGQLSLRGNLAALAHPKTFAAWLRSLFRKDWVVYAKPPFGGPEYVLHYLGRYTHRVAISNHRLVSFTDGKVTFRWRDSAHNNEQKLLTVSLDEFLRRFLLHLLPKGFVRIRNFGFLASCSWSGMAAVIYSIKWEKSAGKLRCHGTAICLTDEKLHDLVRGASGAIQNPSKNRSDCGAAP
jgi:hypothetical protein